MKTHKTHLLQRVMHSLKKVPLEHEAGANGLAQPSHRPGAQVTITIGHAGGEKPPVGEGPEDDPSLESPLMEEGEDDEGINAPFGGFKRPGHKYGK